jgi:hypothetical protein
MNTAELAAPRPNIVAPVRNERRLTALSTSCCAFFSTITVLFSLISVATMPVHGTAALLASLQSSTPLAIDTD